MNYETQAASSYTFAGAVELAKKVREYRAQAATFPVGDSTRKHFMLCAQRCESAMRRRAAAAMRELSRRAA